MDIKERLGWGFGPALAKRYGGTPRKWQLMVNNNKVTHKDWPLIEAYILERENQIKRLNQTPCTH